MNFNHSRYGSLVLEGVFKSGVKGGLPPVDQNILRVGKVNPSAVWVSRFACKEEKGVKTDVAGDSLVKSLLLHQAGGQLDLDLILENPYHH